MNVDNMILDVKGRAQQKRDANLAAHQRMNNILDTAFEALEDQCVQREYEALVDRTEPPRFSVRRLDQLICLVTKNEVVGQVEVEVKMETDTIIDTLHNAPETVVMTVLELLQEHKLTARRPTNY